MDKEQFYKLIENEGALDAGTLEQLKEVTREYPWFQVGWLLYLKNLKELELPEYDEVLKKVAVMVNDRKHLFKFLNSALPKPEVTIEKLKAASSVYRLEGDPEPGRGNSLIDKFLTTETGKLRRVEKAESASGSAVDKELLEKSVAENDEIITETLAAIYFQQKNYEKAQEAYQKLSLKYPEKSVYFATRIKEIEVLKNIN